MRAFLIVTAIIIVLLSPVWLQPIFHVWTCNVQDIKAHATERISQLGMKEVAYEGFMWGIFGGKVWYTVESPTIPGQRFSIYLIKRVGEYHEYGYYPMALTGVINAQGGVK